MAFRLAFIFVFVYITAMLISRKSSAVGSLIVIGSLFMSAGFAGAAELVMFDQPGCVWCQKFEREIADAYVHSEEGEKAPLRRVDIRDQSSSGLALASPVRITPTFVLSADGHEVGRLTGYPGRDFFWTELATLIERLPPAPRPN